MAYGTENIYKRTLITLQDILAKKIKSFSNFNQMIFVEVFNKLRLVWHKATKCEAISKDHTHTVVLVC